MSKKSERVIAHRKLKKEEISEICGSKCAICGYNKCLNALEFHHIDPKEKVFGLSAKGLSYGYETIISELRKCLLLCANCHREVHSNIYSDDFLKSKKYIDEEKIEHLLNKHKKDYFCSKCNKKITKYSTSGLCPKCVAEKTRKVTDRPTKTQLKELIRNKSFVDIGILYGVDGNSVRKWCKKYNLPSRKYEINNITDDEWADI